jgi:hypothetical protein
LIRIKELSLSLVFNIDIEMTLRCNGSLMQFRLP